MSNETMNRSPDHQGRSRLFTTLQALLCCVSLAVAPAFAQSSDSEPPVVGLDGTLEAIKGDNQTFTITATDDESIASIVFNYRFAADENPASETDGNFSTEYLNGEMSRIDQTDRYTFTLAADDIGMGVDAIEYYIEAKDDAGNRTLQGFFFDPLRRTLVAEPTVRVSENELSDTESTSLLGSLSTTQKVVFGTLGVVVVGALIASAGSDGGDDDGTLGDPQQPLVPVTIVSNPP